MDSRPSPSLTEVPPPAGPQPSGTAADATSQTQHDTLTTMLAGALSRMDAVLQMNTLLFVNQMRIDAEIQKINAAKRKIADNTRARIHNALVPEGDRWFEVKSNLHDGPPPYPVKSEYHLLSMSEGQLRALFMYYYGTDVEMDHLTYRAYIRDAIGCRPHRCNSRVHQSPPRSVSGSSTASRSPRVDWETTFSPIVATANVWKTPNSNPLPPGIVDSLGLGSGSGSATRINELMSQALASAGINVQIPTVHNTGPAGPPSTTSAEDSSYSVGHPHTPEIDMSEDMDDSFNPAADMSFESMQSLQSEPLSPSPASRSPPQKLRTPPQRPHTPPTRDPASPFVVPARPPSPGTPGTMVTLSPPPPPRNRITSRVVSTASNASSMASMASSHTELARQISAPEASPRPVSFIQKERPQSIALDQLDSLLSTEMEWDISLEEPAPEPEPLPKPRSLPQPPSEPQSQTPSQPEPRTPAPQTPAPDPATPVPHLSTPAEPVRAANGPFGAVSMVGLSSRLPGSSLLSSGPSRPGSSFLGSAQSRPGASMSKPGLPQTQPGFSQRGRMSVSERLAASFAASRAAKAAAAPTLPTVPATPPTSMFGKSAPATAPTTAPSLPSAASPPIPTSAPPALDDLLPALDPAPVPAPEPSPIAAPISTEAVALPPATPTPPSPPARTEPRTENALNASTATQASATSSVSILSSSTASSTTSSEVSSSRLTARTVSSSSQKSLRSTSTASETVLAPALSQSVGSEYSNSFLHLSTSTTGSLGIDDSREEQFFSPQPSPQPQVPSQPSPQPQLSPRPSPQPQVPSQPSPEPQLSSQPSPEPQLSPRLSPQPQLSPRPSPQPQLSPRPSPQPQLSPRPSPQPQLSPRPSPQPQLSASISIPNKDLPPTPAPQLGSLDLSAGMTDWESLLAETSTPPPKLSASASSQSSFSLRPNTSRGTSLPPRPQSSGSRPLPQTPSTKPKTPTKLAHSMSAVPSSMSTRPEAQTQAHLSRPLPTTPGPLSPSKTFATSLLSKSLNASNTANGTIAPRTPSKSHSQSLQASASKYTPSSPGPKVTPNGTSASPRRFTPSHSPAQAQAQRYTPTHSPYTNSPSRRFTPTRYTPSDSPAPPPVCFAPVLTTSPNNNKGKRGASEPPPGLTKPSFKRRTEYSTILEFWKQSGAAGE